MLYRASEGNTGNTLPLVSVTESTPHHLPPISMARYRHPPVIIDSSRTAPLRLRKVAAAFPSMYCCMAQVAASMPALNDTLMAAYFAHSSISSSDDSTEVVTTME